jgi:hypothetical protein
MVLEHRSARAAFDRHRLETHLRVLASTGVVLFGLAAAREQNRGEHCDAGEK